MTVTCSAGRVALGEPVAGSAPVARLWVLLEQPGPWGRDALRESHLDVSIGSQLAALGEGLPVRVGLIRSVGAHADVTDGSRTLLIARVDRGASWLAARCLDTSVDASVDASVDGVGALADALDVAALLDADIAPEALPGTPLPTPSRALLVCTNAKRDQCCAVLGRPLAASLATETGPDVVVWETSHTGGHRFAPTFVSLPDGYLYGGLDAASQSVGACRGRSALEPAAQVAELAVLRHLGEPRPRPLDVDRLDVDRLDVDRLDVEQLRAEASGDETFVVRDGPESLTVSVTTTSGPDRPESCGKQPVPSTWFTGTVANSHNE